MPPPAKDRRFSGLKDLINHLNAVGTRSLAAIGSKSRSARLQEDEPFVTLQVGKSVFEGAPRRMRTELWMSSLQRKGVGVAAAEKYEDMLLAGISEEAASDIDKDLARTFPSMRRFASPEGQQALGRVLRAYAAFDPEVGYCQGMNFVAGLLLMYLPERHAFGGLVVLMQDRGLRRYYSTDMSLLQTHLWQLGRLMPPRLCAHLEACGVLPLLYGASWLMTCFSADMPASFSARVMDVIMSDKMDQALLKAAVALLRRCEARLLAMNDMEDALRLLKLELPAWEEPLLHDTLSDAFSKPWSTRQLQLLGSLEGAETVAEALARVQKANLLAASTDSLPISDSMDDVSGGGGGGEGAAATQRPGTPQGVMGGGPGSGSSSRAGTPGAALPAPCIGGGGAPLPLFPPPPSPKRTSSSGGGSWPAPAAAPGSGAGGWISSPPPSRTSSRASSHTGALPGLLALHAEGPAHHPAASAGGAAAAAAAADAALPGGEGHHRGQHHHSRLQPGQPPALALASPSSQQQQQQHGDMIDMSSPRACEQQAQAAGVHEAWQGAGAPPDPSPGGATPIQQAAGQAAAGRSSSSSSHSHQGQQQQHDSSWDPFGLHAPAAVASTSSHQQQQQQQQPQQQHVRQQLEEISFSTLSLRAHAAQHQPPSSTAVWPAQQPHHHQQQQQPQQDVDEWSDFI